MDTYQSGIEISLAMCLKYNSHSNGYFEFQWFKFPLKLKIIEWTAIKCMWFIKAMFIIEEQLKRDFVAYSHEFFSIFENTHIINLKLVIDTKMQIYFECPTV